MAFRYLVLLLTWRYTVSAQTHLTKYGTGPVLPRGTYPACDFVATADCCVRAVNDTFKMWYASGGLTPGDSIVHTSISYAWSHDGITWTRHSGNPILNNDRNSWDQLGVETPTIIYDPAAPESLRYRMWYAGHMDEIRYDLGYAYSPDGITWKKYSGNPVISVGTADSWENGFLEGPTVVHDGDTLRMWYAGVDMVGNGQPTDFTVAVGYAWSLNGISWHKHPGNPVLMAGTPGMHDSAAVQDPCVLKIDDTFHIWYGSLGIWEVEGQQIGHAISSDGIHWTKDADNPVLPWGAPGSWDSWRASFPAVVYDNDSLKMWYTGMNKENASYPEPYFWDIGYAAAPFASTGGITPAGRAVTAPRPAQGLHFNLSGSEPGRGYGIRIRYDPNTGTLVKSLEIRGE